MIEETPALTFAPAHDRPAPGLVEGFRGAPTSFVVDAMGGTGALDWRIKPIVGAQFLGVALTCDCGPNDNLALIAAVSLCEPGDVLVASGDLIIGDRDGVVVVPRARLAETLANLERVRTAEAALLARVRGGLRELPFAGG